MARLISVVALAVVWQVLPTAADAQEKSLYERLGGTYAIAVVVDEFIERLVANQTLNANPAIDAARKRVSKAGLKFRVTAMVARAAGGPEVYAGRSMLDSHASLNITEREWQAMLIDLKVVLYKFNVPDAEQAELLAIVESTKLDIVASSPGG